MTRHHQHDELYDEYVAADELQIAPQCQTTDSNEATTCLSLRL